MTKQLLFSVRISDCRVDTFRCPGNGGQNVNKVETGVRIVHPPSGAVGQSCDERTQGQNKKIAWRRMAESEKFKAWHLQVTSELLTGKTVEQRVEEAMEPHNIKVEVRKEGRWGGE